MRPMPLLPCATVALLLAACAGPPPKDAPAAQASAAPAAAIPPAAATPPATSAPPKSYPGYDRVVRDGRVLYCTTVDKTGSHLLKQTSCVTEAEMLQARDQNQRSMIDMQMHTPAQGGH